MAGNSPRQCARLLRRCSEEGVNTVFVEFNFWLWIMMLVVVLLTCVRDALRHQGGK